MNIKSVFDNSKRGIRVTIAVSFSIVAGVSMILLGTILYRQLSVQEEANTTEREEQFLNQTRRSLEDYLHNMRRTSDALYYIGIKNKDMTIDDIDDEMNLLYESDKDNLVNIALYTADGELILKPEIVSSVSLIHLINPIGATWIIGKSYQHFRKSSSYCLIWEAMI